MVSLRHISPIWLLVPDPLLLKAKAAGHLTNTITAAMHTMCQKDCDAQEPCIIVGAVSQKEKEL
jgi:hypothetical protein